jgi:ABC-2 type transport system permease protein
MKTIGYLIQKEFRQIFRNKGMLPIIFILPVIQLLILSNAATYEVRDIGFGYIDSDRTSASRALIEKFESSEYFILSPPFPSYDRANAAMLSGEIDMILEIPSDFERHLVRNEKTELGLTIDAINGAAAGVQNVYVNQIVQEFSQSVLVATATIQQENSLPQMININPSFWYNITLDYKTFMVPGILVLLVTMVTLFLSGMNIVREKEVGTLEQINVTPIRKSQFIIGKLFPFWVIGLVLLTIGLLLAKVIFNIPMVGSLAVLYFYTTIYLLVILGIGLFISNFTNTQQQSMFITWFFVVIFVLMSGLFTPIESMPEWAQTITTFNPIRYFVEVVRMVLLKGAGLRDILPQLWKTLAYATLVNGLAVYSYKKVN